MKYSLKLEEKVSQFTDYENFENIFYELEQKAFELRKNSHAYHKFLKNYFAQNNICEGLQFVLLEELVNYKGSWKHEFLEELKEKLINEVLPPQPINVNESRTKKVIFEIFNSIDERGWQYAFVSEQDYNLFVDLLTNFFEYKPYTLPETTIKLKRDCKTKVGKALGEIHKELSNENKLSTDTKYFQLIRVLNHFEKETEGDLYKALTR